MIDQQSCKLQAANSLIEAGFRIFPVNFGTKVPVLPKWPQQATTAPWMVQEWWGKGQDWNIGVATGAPPGTMPKEDLVVIDVDRKGNVDGLKTVGQMLDWSTVWARTPNRGYHLYYRVPRSVHLKGKVDGVDIQRDGKQVLAPPSAVQKAPWERQVAYEWGNPPGPPWDVGIKMMPLELMMFLMDVPRGTSGTSGVVSPPWEFDPELPLLLPEDQTPQWQACWDNLKPSHQWFLSLGILYEFPSRSEMIHSLSVRLYQLGYQDDQVLSMLWYNAYVMDTVLEKRGGDEAKALDYIWFSCKKTRHHRKKTVEEVFKDQTPRAQPQAQPGPPPWESDESQVAEPPPWESDPPPWESGPAPQAESQAQANPYDLTLAALRNQAMRLTLENDVHPFLKEMAVAKLGPIDRDLVLDILKRAGFTKSALQAQLKVYEREVVLAERERPTKWVHTYGEEDRPLGTVENLEVLLGVKRAIVRHNLMNHRIEVTVDGNGFKGEDALNNQITQVRSWAAEHRMPLDTVAEQLVMLAQRHEYHPFQTYVEKRPWDGVSRIHKVFNTVEVHSRKAKLKRMLMERWFISIVASVYDYHNRPPRGVLTFVGKQSIGKTTWLKYVTPPGMYHEGLILRATDRDSVTKGLRYLVVELGEVGSTFKQSDIEQLKAHIGKREDVWRLSYARDESIWKRRTVFAASANDDRLLRDQTGNTRWWVLPVQAFDLNAMERMSLDNNGYELQQFWAEIKLMYDRGAAWDLTDEELAYHERHMEDHTEETSIETAIRDTYDWQKVRPEGGYRLPRRISDIARDIGLSRPFTPAESREVRMLLRRLTGQEEGQYRRISLATLDGEDVSEDWKKLVEKDISPTSSKAGRWWYLPKKISEIPFTPSS